MVSARARIARMAPHDDSIASNLSRIRQRIAQAARRAGRDVSEITLVAVSKTFSADAIRPAYELGLRHFGENRVQEWESKRGGLSDLDATWHLIGHLQSNKVRRAANLFSRVDSVDSIGLGEKLDAAAGAEGKRLPILIEVHLGDEATKSGVTETELAVLAQSVASFKNLDLLGLMTIPPFFDDLELVRPFFRKLREFRDELNQKLSMQLRVLSMGMSHDFEIAIEEGATEVRIGSALFGERKKA